MTGTDGFHLNSHDLLRTATQAMMSRYAAGRSHMLCLVDAVKSASWEYKLAYST
jgi:hypothetical protein